MATVDDMRALGYRVSESSASVTVEGFGLCWVFAPGDQAAIDEVAEPNLHALRVRAAENPPGDPTIEQRIREADLRLRALEALTTLEAALDAWQPPAEAALANLEAADANWDALTAAQKDGVLRLAARVAAIQARKDETLRLATRVTTNVLRIALRQLDV